MNYSSYTSVDDRDQEFRGYEGEILDVPLLHMFDKYCSYTPSRLKIQRNVVIDPSTFEAIYGKTLCYIAGLAVSEEEWMLFNIGEKFSFRLSYGEWCTDARIHARVKKDDKHFIGVTILPKNVQNAVDALL